MKITGLAAALFLAFAIATPALTQTSPSGGIGTLPPPPASTTQGPDHAQNPPGGERGSDRPGDEKSPRASH